MKTLGSIALLGALLTSPAHAQTYDGAWTLNRSRSVWSTGAVPNGLKVDITLKQEATDLVAHAVVVSADGRSQIADFAAPMDDTVAPLTGVPGVDQVRVRRLAPDVLQVLEQEDGRLLVGQHWQVSADGKSFVRWGVVADPGGNSRSFYEWFDRAR